MCSCSKAHQEQVEELRVNCYEIDLGYEVWVNGEPIYFTTTPSFRSWRFYPIRNGLNAIKIVSSRPLEKFSVEAFVVKNEEANLIELQKDGKSLRGSFPYNGEDPQSDFRILGPADKDEIINSTLRIIDAMSDTDESAFEDLFKALDRSSTQFLPDWVGSGTGDLQIKRNDSDLSVLFGSKMGLVSNRVGDDISAEPLLKITNESAALSFEIKSMSFSIDGEENIVFWSSSHGPLVLNSDSR